MKLFMVNFMGYSGDYSELMVAESEEKVIEKAYKEDDQCYSIYANEVTEIDGRKITVT